MDETGCGSHSLYGGNPSETMAPRSKHQILTVSEARMYVPFYCNLLPKDCTQNGHGWPNHIDMGKEPSEMHEHFDVSY